MNVHKVLAALLAFGLIDFPRAALATQESPLLLRCTVTNRQIDSTWDATLKIDMQAGVAVFHEMTFPVKADSERIHGAATEKLFLDYQTRKIRLDRITGSLWIETIREGKPNAGLTSLSAERLDQLTKSGINPITLVTGKCVPAKPIF